MVNLLEQLESTESSQTPSLNQLKVSEEPVMILLFTPDVEKAPLHYESDESVRSYLPCPGINCPVCYLGSAPKEFFLLPVYNFESRDVEILRIPTKRGPDTLASAIKPFLQDPEISDKVLILTRNVHRYHLESRPLLKSADRGARAIQAFQQKLQKGLKLTSAFPNMTIAEIAEIERVKRKLDAMGGFEILGAE
jgi:hypothetical protein